MANTDFVVSFLPYEGIWTYYTRENGSIIIKGAYQENSELFQQMITRSIILKQWQTPYILHPTGISEQDGDIWLEFPNAIGHFPLRHHLHQPDDDEPYYLSDELIPTLSRVTKANEVYYNYDLLKAYVHLYIINSGSHTPFTTLIDHQKNIVIPEYTGYANPVSNKLFYLNKGDYILDDRRYELFAKHYAKLADELVDLDVGVGYQLRKERAIKLLRKYAITSKVS